MFDVQTDSIALLADGLALVYHEARHVRHLVRAGYLLCNGWEQLLSLPTNRVEAWRTIAPSRRAASGSPDRVRAAQAFERRFSKTVDDLRALYGLSHWRHASSVGGHAWHEVVALVSDLGDAIDQRDASVVLTVSEAILQGRHNNGFLRDKILGLDAAIGVTTGAWWRSVPRSTPDGVGGRDSYR